MSCRSRKEAQVCYHLDHCVDGEVGPLKDNGEVFQTQWSVVYNLDRGTAKICMGGKYDEVHELSIA